MMSLQDIPIKNSSHKACVMFDNGSEITLVSSVFTKRNNLPYKEATYTIVGIGSKAKPTLLVRTEEFILCLFWILTERLS